MAINVDIIRFLNRESFEKSRELNITVKYLSFERNQKKVKEWL